MDFSGPQGELQPMAMHAGGGSPFLGLHHEHEHHHHHHRGANGRHSMSPPEAVEGESHKDRHALAVVPVSSAGGVRYRECLKNHAAAIGGSATDGCGEFMPAGEEGSLDALRCSACGCHRNFHRREPPGSDGGRHHQLYHHHQQQQHHHHQMAGGGPLSPLHHHHRGMLVAALPPAPTRMVMPLSASAAAAVQHHHQHQLHGGALSAESDEAGRPRKRFRTKFTAEQKARMLGFAEAAGWRLQKLEDAAVQRFCQEVGVKRRVLKVWMHNNKHTLARRHADDHHHEQQPQPGDGQPMHSDHPGRQSPSPMEPQLRLE